MVIIRSKEHLKKINRANNTSRKNKFNSPDFESIEMRSNRGEFSRERKAAWNDKPSNLDDGKNNTLSKIKSKPLREKKDETRTIKE